MSYDISYVVKVIDEFTAPLKKFQAEIAKTNALTGSFGANLKTTSLNAQSAASNGIATYNSGLNQTKNSLDETSKSSKFFTQNLKDLGKATGIYFGFTQIKHLGEELFETQMKMQGFSTSLGYILKRFDSTIIPARAAANEIEYLREVSNKLGVSFDVVSDKYNAFLGAASSRFNLKDTHKIFEAFTGLARMYHLNDNKLQGIYYALENSITRGAVSLNVLHRQFNQHLPGSSELFLEAARNLSHNQKLTMKEMEQMMRKGNVGAGIFLEMANIVNEKFTPAIQASTHALDAQFNMMKNNRQSMMTNLSELFAPAMMSGVMRMKDIFGEMADIFGAINNQNAFKKLDDDTKGWVSTLRVAEGMLQGMGTILSGIGGVIKGGAGLATDAVSAGYVGLSSLFGDDYNSDVSGRAFSEIWHNTKRHAKEFASIPDSNAPQKIQIDINHNNVPNSVNGQIKHNGSSKVPLRTGNTVIHAGG